MLRLSEDGIVVSISRDKVDLETVTRWPVSVGERDGGRHLRVGITGRLFLDQSDWGIVKETGLKEGQLCAQRPDSTFERARGGVLTWLSRMTLKLSGSVLTASQEMV